MSNRSTDKLAEIEQRYRDDPNMYWVPEVAWLLSEVERLWTLIAQHNDECRECPVIEA